MRLEHVLDWVLSRAGGIFAGSQGPVCWTLICGVKNVVRSGESREQCVMYTSWLCIQGYVVAIKEPHLDGMEAGNAAQPAHNISAVATNPTHGRSQGLRSFWRPASVASLDADAIQAAERAAEEEELEWYRATIESFSRLAVWLHKQHYVQRYPELTQLPQLATGELKKLLVDALRHELLWAARRSVPEVELLFRTDLDKDTGEWDKVHWQELQQLIQWALEHVTPVGIMPGASQPFYVDLADQIQVALRVPKLHLQSARWVPVHMAW